MDFKEIPVNQIIAPATLRGEHINVDELVESIREHGLLQPIRVRPIGPNAYQVIAGHRRLIAHQRLNRPTISAIVAEEDEQTSAVQAIVENLQREDLAPLDLAKGIRHLALGFQIELDTIAKLISKSPGQVRTWLRLARLPDDVLSKLESGEGRTHQVSGLAPRHLQPFVADLPSEEEAAKDAETAALREVRLADVRELQDEVDSRGVRINAHMADEIARSSREGEITVREAMDRVLADPDRYRYKAPIATPDEIEKDTFASYRKIHADMLALAHRLRPEIAVSFSEDKKRVLLGRLKDLTASLQHYDAALNTNPMQKIKEELPSSTA